MLTRYRGRAVCRPRGFNASWKSIARCQLTPSMRDSAVSSEPRQQETCPRNSKRKVLTCGEKNQQDARLFPALHGGYCAIG